MSSENEEDTAHFLRCLIEWLGVPIDYVTIDFSDRLEAGVKQFFEDDQIQKGVFHACQLLTRGLLKELVKRKNEKYLDEIKEWLFIRRRSLRLEKGKESKDELSMDFEGPRGAWEIYRQLRHLFSLDTPKKIERAFKYFFNSSRLSRWEGCGEFKEKCKTLFPKRGLTKKGLKYFKKKVYSAWRTVIRKIRKKLEEKKAEFNDVKYLVLMNPVNMDPYQYQELRRLLKIFPWLRPIRKKIVKFYYQFRLPPKKRSRLTFLLGLLSEDSHPRLKSAVHTLIENEDKVFRFQVIWQDDPGLKDVKAIKVVNEPTMRKINDLYRTQNGMRNLENLEMRTSHYLDCPLIVVPSVREN